MTKRTRWRLVYLILPVLLCYPPTKGNAVDAFHQVNSNQFVLFFDKTAIPVDHNDRRAEVEGTIRSVIEVLTQVSNEIGQVFKAAPTDKVKIRFLSSSAFQRQTGTFPWMSAVFSQGEVSVPVQEGKGIKPTELARNLKHEYVHVLVAQLSKYRCPAWLDEGLAQLFEGHHSRLLAPELRRWAQAGRTVSLTEIEEGFAQHENRRVVLSYAQSLFLTKLLADRFGVDQLIVFLHSLGEGQNFDTAFKKHFTMSPEDFARLASGEIRAWAKTEHLQLEHTFVQQVKAPAPDAAHPVVRAAPQQ